MTESEFAASPPFIVVRADRDWAASQLAEIAAVAEQRREGALRRLEEARRAADEVAAFASRAPLSRLAADAVGLIRPRLARRLIGSSLFLAGWYAAKHALPSRRAALRHYLTIGLRLDHAPNPLFDPSWYRASHVEAGRTEPPIWHYLRIGARNALAPGPLFDPICYLADNPDLAREPDLLAHYLRRGWREGRGFLPEPVR